MLARVRAMLGDGRGMLAKRPRPHPESSGMLAHRRREAPPHGCEAFACGRLAAGDRFDGFEEREPFVMEAAMTAIEVTGTVDENHRLRLDEALPVSGPMRVRVIVLYPLVEGAVEEDEWLRAAARNPVFRDLEAPEEDIYSLEDGEPFSDQV
jgi:hypothetical protein